MSITKNIVALVPMRHFSERVVGKNYREMAGKPLFHYIIETLAQCEEISKIIVDTDSPTIIKGLATHFPDVVVLERPEHLCDDKIPMNEILLYDTAQVEADYYLQTHSTNPLLKTETISKAIQTFYDNNKDYDSLFSVTAWHTRLYDENGKAINHNPNELLRTQDLPPVYEENSCIYIFNRQTLVERNHRLGNKPMMFEIDSREAMDIDEEIDFSLTEFLANQYKNN
ncbi:MAG: acylneuraminate cytidylyltransferase family protein [Chloroflexi bacterium]|jgi:CMP-N-acetylneuraminic acid synthetase|nr:acylneuraminate cytidylyltransferase family protein [Chloroflexota bacterium]MBT3670045.1 acylneuraminate cytidylyltransferase family protein [Chloroflexota bacterium]MBT4003532.1 acylneuraminate cytidylyltransferase family protein [Chloroflexota bacterium]MBT4306753.1 acylneuraminate cytidylyltransferase family protein [Chloroflexota bacterium]MBT4532931.1 acylneuraminate cytidylyltransferase family protein [Chloroflexota bacterium]